MHGMLVMIHIVLFIFCVLDYPLLSFTSKNSDFLSAILSASLQAFYTIYTAVLLFLTQRLAISRTLVRRVKLTAVHDISGAWAGLGSALTSVWRQTDIPASRWTTSAVAIYLASITGMNNTSPFPTTLGWPHDSSYGSFTNLGPIAASLPVINHLAELVFPGLSNTTLYDTLTYNLTNGYATGNVTVNATTVTSSCGLIPNVTYSANTSTAILPFGRDSFMLNMSIPSLWPDQIHIIPWTEYEDSDGDSEDSELDGIYIMISTLLGIDPSVQDEVAVNMTWAIPNIVTPYTIQVYFVYCSLSVNTSYGEIDAMSNSLLSSASISQPSMQWEMYSDYQLESGQSNTSSWKTQISKALATNYSSGMVFERTRSQIIEPSIVDEYIMSLVGLNLAEEYTQFRAHGALPVTNFTLTPDELEYAVAKVAAQLIWLAGQMGTANGGIDPGNGLAHATLAAAFSMTTTLQLNINLLPLAFAASASVIMLGLALHMTRAFDASHDRQVRAAITNIGVLQLLWLSRRSTSINEVLEEVQHPTEANLRRAGMIDVCFSHIIPDKGEVESSIVTESLTRDVDQRRDDEE
ncbi:uncharacterized protein F5891DRAFT_1279268 [Suillus fuscotomentosus]|uniref:Uncharacterized protein n=1 Tax=Suillus fuscotomentosus TaxID=1912939 RepID=A0AAD4HJX5_9AGAM|nr:uncharacterized protein F5891DRAFT_1279268 [Suillus fuscotomentosus]KAG1898901.1 hypothetical protein F5891DRAFT_1279268 [Suillus fuscotomentosus]